MTLGNSRDQPWLCLNLKNLKQNFELEFLAGGSECRLVDRDNYEAFLGVIGVWEIENQNLINSKFTDAYQ